MFRDNRGSQEGLPGRPEVRAAIAHMEDLMRTDRRYNHAGVPIQVAVNLINMGVLNSFGEFEGMLREVDSRVYFVGVPLDFYGPQWADRTVNPFNTTMEPEYTLWTGVNGTDEAEAMLAALEITAEDNSRRLLTTGVLSVG